MNSPEATIVELRLSHLYVRGIDLEDFVEAHDLTHRLFEVILSGP
jgi:hypothetical protein